MGCTTVIKVEKDFQCEECPFCEKFVNSVSTDRGEKYELDIRCTLEGNCIFEGEN